MRVPTRKTTEIFSLHISIWDSEEGPKTIESLIFSGSYGDLQNHFSVRNLKPGVWTDCRL